MINGKFKNFEIKIEKPFVKLRRLNISPKNYSLIYPHKTTQTDASIATLQFKSVEKENYPDFIYIDGPDPSSIKNFTDDTKNKKKLPPCVIDILNIEDKLAQGTIVMIDGREFNAYILWNNFKRKWSKTIFPNQGFVEFKLIK